MIVLLALACGAPCGEARGALRDRVQACGGFEESAWRDADDFDAWCDAWGLEQRALARDAGTPLDCGAPPDTLSCEDALAGAAELAGAVNE